MSGIFGTALTGLNRAAVGINVAASNIANGSAPVNGHGNNSIASRDAIGPSSGVSLASNLINLKRHEAAFSANATLIDLEDRRLGELLDLIG